MSGVAEGVGQQNPEFFLRPPPIPEWTEAFNKWQSQGVFTGSIWAELFDAWLRPRWPLLHNQGLRDPVADPSRWTRLFTFWSHELMGLHAQEHPPLPMYPTTTSGAHPVQQSGSSTTTPAPYHSQSRIRNTTSRLTAAEIQQACTTGEPAARDSITIMFPPNNPISRDDLKKKPGGSAHSHRSYMVFVGLRGLRYYCRLCDIGRADWKNDKDLLDHIWNKHFDI